jgi:hypothetical protein
MGAITLQFVTCSDPGSWAIRTFQRGWCSHVDSVMDDGRLLGARPDAGVAGVQIRPPNYQKFVRQLAPCVNRLDVRDLYLVVSAIARVS